MTIIQHRDCGDEQEKKERVFEAWVLIDDKGICDVALHKLWRPVNEERVLPCRVIVEEES